MSEVRILLGPLAAPPAARRLADEAWMEVALLEAARAERAGEVPVGALVVRDGVLVGRGHNHREAWQDPTAHAEVLALQVAARRLGSWRLGGCSVYVTLEPCPMCAGALVNARVERVVYGARDPKAGATETLYRLGDDPRLNHRFEAEGGVLEAECAAQLSAFFRRIRRRRRSFDRP